MQCMSREPLTVGWVEKLAAGSFRFTMQIILEGCPLIHDNFQAVLLLYTHAHTHFVPV